VKIKNSLYVRVERREAGKSIVNLLTRVMHHITTVVASVFFSLILIDVVTSWYYINWLHVASEANVLGLNVATTVLQLAVPLVLMVASIQLDKTKISAKIPAQLMVAVPLLILAVARAAVIVNNLRGVL
jgi:hypothetical protein